MTSNSKKSITKLVRALSALESMLVRGKVMVITLANLRGAINPTILEQALQLIVKRHPLLGSRIVPNTNLTSYIEFNPVKI